MKTAMDQSNVKRVDSCNFDEDMSEHFNTRDLCKSELEHGWYS